ITDNVVGLGGYMGYLPSGTIPGRIYCSPCPRVGGRGYPGRHVRRSPIPPPWQALPRQDGGRTPPRRPIPRGQRPLEGIRAPREGTCGGDQVDVAVQRQPEDRLPEAPLTAGIEFIHSIAPE